MEDVKDGKGCVNLGPENAAWVATATRTTVSFALPLFVK
jgi:hypothetical protein